MFKTVIYSTLFFSTLLIFNSCGKEDNSNKGEISTYSKNDLNTRSLLVSPRLINIHENQTNVTTLFLKGKNNITYSISGDDKKEFDVNHKSGVVTFKVAPNYEKKKLYTFIAKAIDAKGNEYSNKVIVNIMDIDEDKNNISRIFYVSQIAQEGEKVRQPTIPTNTHVGDAPTAPPTSNTPSAPTAPVENNNPTPTAPEAVNPTPVNNVIEDEEDDILEEVDKQYTRDNSKNIVTDDTTKLMWQDNVGVKTFRMDWDEATMHCDNMSLGGYTDWKLPTLMELNIIIDNKKSNTSLSAIFKNIISSNYWSSTKYVPNANNAWSINLYHGNTYGSHKLSRYYVTCVRGRI